MSKSDPRWHYVALFFVCLAAGFWPYREVLHHYPEGADAVKWATSAAPVTRGWFDWVFKSRHFIGYRPVTAMSFTANYALTGWSPWGYRLTNAGLHIGTGLAVYGAFRVLARDRGWWGVVAAAVFFAHPSSETVLPHLARRSYLFGSLFSVLALTSWTVATRSQRALCSGPVAWTCLALAIALLSNEIAYVVVPVLVLTAFLFRDRQRSRLDPLWRSLPVLGIAVSLIGLRYYILGHMGGYHKRYLAYTRNNHNTIKEVDDTPYQVFFEAAWSYVCFPTGASGEQALLLGGAAGMVVALLVAAYYAWRALIAPLLPAADQNRRILLLLFLWICGHAVLYALTRNWFWRQSYPMLAPFALLVTMAARETWDSPRSLVWKGAHFLPQGVLLVSILHHSPALHGLNRQALKGQFKASEIIAYITEDLAGEPVQEPAIIYLAMPVRGPAIREALLWLRRESPGRHRRFLWLAVLRAASKDMSHEPVVDHVTTGERARLVLRGHGQWDTKLAKSMDITGKQMIRTDRLHVRGAHAYVYVTSGEREYALWKVTAPAADEEPLQRRRRGRKKGKAQDATQPP